jgi:hypothetical protein
MSERMLDMTGFVAGIEEVVARHAMGTPGAYRRWLTQDEKGSRDLGINPYGCADAANILYTVGRFPRDRTERRGWVETLHGLQESGDGLFHEATHHPIHTTAHCLAALELFDAGPRQPLTGLAELRDPSAMERFLSELDWQGNPWGESHRGAGLWAALVLSGEASIEWQERYFAWLWNEADPHTGLFRRGCIPESPAGDQLLFPHLAGTFHYLFNLQHARRPLRHPQALIDTCLDIQRRELFPLSRFVGFAEIDWVYCLTRSLRQSGHRFDECKSALLSFAEHHATFLNALDPATDEELNDLHALFGTLCAVAELQQALPGLIRTERPLRLVLDRRPFI